MSNRVQLRLYTEIDEWLCFRHAISFACAGDDVQIEVGDFEAEGYVGRTHCKICSLEKKWREAEERTRSLFGLQDPDGY